MRGYTRVGHRCALEGKRSEYPALVSPAGLLHFPPPRHELWWVLSSPRVDPTEHLLKRHHLVEARTKEYALVIWFGSSQASRRGRLATPCVRRFTYGFSHLEVQTLPVSVRLSG
jgi:hypothetical protein